MSLVVGYVCKGLGSPSDMLVLSHIKALNVNAKTLNYAWKTCWEPV